MQHVQQPSIRDVALIGDQRSCALIDKEGTVAWYCLWRFDQPSLFSLLIDEQGGYWSVEAPGKQFTSRKYTDQTAVLETEFAVSGGTFTVTDFMPLTAERAGICRLCSAAPVDVTMRIFPRPDYGRASASLKQDVEKNTVSDHRFAYYLTASHPLRVTDHATIELTIPAGEKGWCMLVDDQRALKGLCTAQVQYALGITLANWRKIMGQISYQGPYQTELYQSYRAIQLLTHVQSGGILAAATTSLPEVPGGIRNYDYRYVWLRDTAMNVGALIEAGSRGNEADRFLDFLCAARTINKKNLFVPFYDLDHKTAPNEEFIPGSGYRHSTPLRIGNDACDQLQLDAQANVLMAAWEVYEQIQQKTHWQTILHTAEYLVRHWQTKDHGIWEEKTKEQYTSSKVLVAKSLELLAAYADTEQQKQCWLRTAQDIRAFISQHCMTSDGAYAVYAGSEEVDITAALYPVWTFDAPDSPAMQQTIRRIEAQYLNGLLYHRHLVESNSKEEGVFLAASLWMAEYYLTLRYTEKAKTIIDAVLSYATDLGFLPEEGDVQTGELLGNIPQTFVHSSLIRVILDYQKLL